MNAQINSCKNHSVARSYFRQCKVSGEDTSCYGVLDILCHPAA